MTAAIRISIRIYVMVMLVVIATGAAMSGCVSTPPATAPTVTIVSPPNGSTVSGGNVTVTVRVTNFNVVDKQGQASVPGEGHLHFYMDVTSIPSIPGQPAIPADANAVWAHVSGTTYTFTNVPPGTHNFSVQLANNDHTPVIPLATDSVTATVTQAPGAPAIVITSPRDGATLSAGNLTVTAQVTNFNVVDKQGQASIPGEGHLHFYMDVSPIPSTPGQPAIPPNANAVWAHVSGTTYTFANVPSGTHIFSVQLANNDHTPVIPLVTDSVTVTISTGTAAPEIIITSPAEGGIVGPDNFTVSVEVKNFNLADRIGQANIPGQGHIVYYLDVAPSTRAGTPAIPATGKYAASAATSYFWDNVPIGIHQAAVELVNNDNTPLVPPATDSIPVVVRGLGTPGGGGGGGGGGY